MSTPKEVLVAPVPEIIAAFEVLKLENGHLGDPESHQRGQSPHFDAYIERLLSKAEWLPRPQAEKDEGYRQIIPYVTLTQGVGDSLRVLSYRRPSKGLGDARIQGNRSVGFGGHVDRDANGLRNDMYYASKAIEHGHDVQHAMERELREELGVDPCKAPPLSTVIFMPRPYKAEEYPQLQGTISLHGTEVDRVHLGFHYVWDVSHLLDLTFKYDPAEVGELQWSTIAELRTDHTLESWSYHALHMLSFHGIPSP